MPDISPPGNHALRLLAGFCALSVLTGVLLAGLLLPVVGASGAATRGALDTCSSLSNNFEALTLPEGSTFYASDSKTPLAKIYSGSKNGENRTVVPLDQIATTMQAAIIAIEDSRFTQHGGIDLQGTLRALVNNETGGDTQGGSTLTQQLVKNSLIEAAIAKNDKAAIEAARERSKIRKAREACIAFKIESSMSKEQILQGYLNIVNFTYPYYGVESAARYYFNTSAKNLTLSQAALLAGMVQSPGSYDPLTEPQKSKERRNTVLMRMRELTKEAEKNDTSTDQLFTVSEEQYQKALKDPLPTKVYPSHSGCIAAKEHAYFCDYAYKFIQRNDQFKFLGATAKDRIEAIATGGYHVITSADAAAETGAQKTLNKYVYNTDPQQASATTVEPGTGRVISMVQNRDFDVDRKGPVSSTSVNYNTDEEYGGSTGFPVGSSFKSFVLAAWLADGRQLNDVINGAITSFPVNSFTACGSKIPVPNAWTPKNSAKNEYHPYTVLDATAASVNTVYAGMEQRLDMCKLRDLSTKMGIHLAAKGHKDCYRKEDEDKYEARQLPTNCPSITLGAMELSPLTMASAYATFAADGLYCKPSPVDKITDREGKLLYTNKPDCSRAFSAEIARGVTYTLKDVIDHGTAAQIKGDVPWPAAGKTGTTDGPTATWFVGYTKQRSTAAMLVSNNTAVSLDNHTFAGKRYGHIFGATIAAPVWAGIMQYAMKDLPKQDWENPPSSMIGSTARVATKQNNNDSNGNKPTKPRRAGRGAQNTGTVPSPTGPLPSAVPVPVRTAVHPQLGTP